GMYPLAVTVDPSGRFVYVANNGSGTNPGNVSAYTITVNGTLTEVRGSPFRAGNSPYAVTVDPSDKFAFVANEYSNNVSAYFIDQRTGALFQLPDSPFPAGSIPNSIITTR
ncbi:MAG: beta-propeller fold lactonase family protein, partial [Candidatus Binataceae bacterium]